MQNIDQESDSDELTINEVIDVFSQTVPTISEPKMFISVEINNKSVNFECDTGSPVTIISQKDFTNLDLNSRLRKTNVCFRSYTKHLFRPIGYAEVSVSYKGNQFVGDLYVVPDYGSPIMGRRWIRALNITLQDVNNVSIKSIEEVIEEYKDVFKQEVGKMKDFKCSLLLNRDAKPVFMKPRRVPYALVDEVERELDTLEREGIIEKTDHSEWGTPLVIVPKSNGKLRLCADYKVTVNHQLQDNRYPIPRIEDIFAKMQNGKYFCTLDIFKAYLHIPVDEESAKVQAISTHRGTYLAKRLFFGIKTAPNEFHKIVDQIVHDLEGTTAYFDDILVQGSTREECKQRLIKVLQRLREYNLHLNRDKCKFFEKKIKYLGHIITEEGLQKAEEKVKAILDAPRPRNVKQLQQFLGMVMYYSSFLPGISSTLFPLNRLLRKDVEFKWTPRCEMTFNKVKQEIASDRVLMPFSPEYPITIATDASPYGLSGVLSHRLHNGTERPVAFISRSLTKAESNYSQLDKEATAIYWAFKKLFHYIYGRKFTLIVDNKPLMTIFNPTKQLPALSATRMLRYAQYLSGFDYKIEHRKSSSHANADYFSRNPLKLDPSQENSVDDEYFVNNESINYICSDIITAEDVARETNRDPELCQLKSDLLDGTLRDCEFSLQNGIILRGNRVVIPRKLQPAMLKELHSTHVGIVKMKSLARNYCYWRGIDSDIENLVKSCSPCCAIKKNPVKAPIHQWEPPTRNWQRVHIDYAGRFLNHFFLIIVDAKSKWPEIYMTREDPTSAGTIHFLRETFSRLGIPEILVSDNATIFKSAEFTEFCKRNGIIQKTIAPGHPATNGQAERYCSILKSKLKCMLQETGNLHEKLTRFLLKFRITPLACGKTPAEILYGYNLRTTLDLIRPKERVTNTAKQPVFSKGYNMGDRVQSRNYVGYSLWKYGTVVKRLGRLHYLVELDEGYTLKRHYNQLRMCQVEKPQENPASVVQNPNPGKLACFSRLPVVRCPVRATTPRRESTLQPVQGSSPIPATPEPSSPQPPQNSSPKSRQQQQSITNPPLRKSTRIRNPVDRFHY